MFVSYLCHNKKVSQVALTQIETIHFCSLSHFYITDLGFLCDFEFSWVLFLVKMR